MASGEVDINSLNFDALKDGPIECKGILKGTESITRQAEVYLELLKDDGKTAMLVGPSASFTKTIPNFPSSLLGCDTTELEYISGFFGLQQIAAKKTDEVAAVLAKDPEFFLTLSRFIVCTPEIAPEITNDERFSGSTFAETAFPTPLQSNVPFAFVMASGPLGLLRDLLTKTKTQKTAILKGLAEAKYATELVYRLCDFALGKTADMESVRKAAVDILAVMVADGPTAALCARTQMPQFAIDNSKAGKGTSTPAAAAPAAAPAAPAASAKAAKPAAATSAAAASSSAPSAAAVAAGEVCARCGGTGEGLKRCARCLTIAYCGRECQTAHWSEHKPFCKKP